MMHQKPGVSVLMNDCLSLVWLKLFSKPMRTGSFSQALCFAKGLLYAREFARTSRVPVEYYPRLSEQQEQSEQSSPCVVPEIQGWSHLDVGVGILAGILAGVALAVLVGLKYCHLGKLSVCSAFLCQRGQRDECRGQDGRDRSSPTSRDEAFCKTAMPGTGALVFYVDDDVWYDRMLVRRVGAPGVRLWVIATPDKTDPG